VKVTKEAHAASAKKGAEGQMKKTARRLRVAFVVTLVATALALVASTATAASGPKKGLRLAFFSVGGNNTYLLAGMRGAKDAAKKYGASIQVFDGKFDGVCS
jgi:ABC-type sugar transport system substrate-binding protein